jgi:hypothetical protein
MLCNILASTNRYSCRQKKEAHTVVNCIILHCRSQTILYVNTSSYLIFNINDDNLFKKNLEHYVSMPSINSFRINRIDIQYLFGSVQMCNVCCNTSKALRYDLHSRFWDLYLTTLIPFPYDNNSMAYKNIASILKYIWWLYRTATPRNRSVKCRSGNM